MKTRRPALLFSSVIGLALILLFSSSASAYIPKINSISPAAASVGETVLITGQGFSGTPAANIVFFGPVEAQVVAATTTQLSVTVPAGPANDAVTVTVAGVTAYSPGRFIVKYGGSAGASTFGPRISLPSGGILRMGTVADLDGDGRPDIAGTNDNGYVTICRDISSPDSLGVSSFAAAINFPVGARPYKVAMGDLDGDGKLDLVVATNSSPGFTVLRNTSTPGSLSFTRMDFYGPSAAQYATVADLDMDGKPDVVITNTGGTGVSVFRNTSSQGTISFAPEVDLPLIGGGYAVEAADLDGNGIPDLLVASTPNSVSNALSVFRNLSSPGQLSFATRLDFAVGTLPRGLAVGDIDGDGKQDVVVTTGFDWYVHPKYICIFRNTSSQGMINFASRVDIPSTDSTSWDVRLADFNGDGKLDIAVPVVGVARATATILWNEGSQGSISFPEKTDLVSDGGAYGIDVADLNLDGKPDIILHNFSGDGFTIFENLGPAGPGSVTLSMPDTIAMLQSAPEIPVYASDLTNQQVLAFQMTLAFNSPDTILTASDTLDLSNTICGAAGWSVQANALTPNTIVIAGYGATPLSGRGALLRIRFSLKPNVTDNQTTVLHFTSALLNAGTPITTTNDGRLTLRNINCGDADENGSVQAFDAALTLREAIGPMPAPPAPLTPQGRLNADVDMNGLVQAYDAALILRHVLGLPMPAGASTCFDKGLGRAGMQPLLLSKSGIAVEPKPGISESGVSCFAITSDQSDGIVLSVSFSVEVPPSAVGGTPFLTGYSNNSMVIANSVSNGRTNIGIIDPQGISLKDLVLTIPVQKGSTGESATISHIVVNNHQDQDLTLSLSAPTEGIQGFKLIGNYPNPFNPSSTIVFALPEQAPVVLEIYDANGAKVKELINGLLPAGVHQIVWDGTNAQGNPVASGTYLCQMRSAKRTNAIQMLLVR